MENKKVTYARKIVKISNMFTADKLKKLKELAGVINFEFLCLYFDISKDEFRGLLKTDAKVRNAYNEGRVGTMIKVAQALVKAALKGNVQAMEVYLVNRLGFNNHADAVNNHNITTILLNAGELREIMLTAEQLKILRARQDNEQSSCLI